MKRARTSARRRLALLAVSALALPAGCSSPETAAIIEVQSELGEALTRVEIEMRDGDDRTSGDTFTFDSEHMPKHRAPFSFRALPPAGEERSSFVVRATAYAGRDFLAETKQRVQFEPGETIHRVVRLWRACKQLRCDDGTTCDPERVECAPVLDAATPSQRVSGMTGSRDGAADGGPREDAAQPDPDGSANARDAEPEAGAGAPGPTDRAGTEAAGATAQSAGAGGEAGSPGRGAASAGSSAGDGGAAGSAGADGGAAGHAGADADGGAGASAGEGGMTAPGGEPSGVLREPDDWASVMNAGRNYIIRNNVYNQDASQVVSYQGTSFTIESVTGSASSGISSPDVHIGSIYGLATLDSNLPKPVSEVGGIYVGASHNAGAAINGSYNMHQGLWLSRGAGPDPVLPTGGALEVWLYATPGRLPPGERIESAATVSGSLGQWDVWLGSFGDGPCVTYLRTEALSSFAGNLDAFLTDAVERGAIEDSWSVMSVYTGFELLAGGVGLRVTDVTMAVE